MNHTKYKIKADGGEEIQPRNVLEIDLPRLSLICCLCFWEKTISLNMILIQLHSMATFFVAFSSNK